MSILLSIEGSDRTRKTRGGRRLAIRRRIVVIQDYLILRVIVATYKHIYKQVVVVEVEVRSSSLISILILRKLLFFLYL